MDEAMPGGDPEDLKRTAHDDAESDGAVECAAGDAAEDEFGNEPATGPRPLEVGVVPTGHGEVDAQLRRLEDADHLAVSGHLEVYEDVHRGLRSTLTALDQNNPGS